MATLHRRVQVLFDPERYELLESMTHETGRSVGALVREAVDAMLDSDGPGGNLERQTALARLWASGDEAPHPAPDNWEDVKASFERPFPRLS